MEAHIFAEDSKTTADEKELQLKDYYQGLFDIVSDLHDELSQFETATDEAAASTPGEQPASTE